jgi:hypothetical protein
LGATLTTKITKELRMNQHEINEWLDFLCVKDGENFRRCRSDEERISVIENLLYHAKKDRMSEEDVKVCKTALKDLLEKVESNPTEVVSQSTIKTLEQRVVNNYSKEFNLTH